MNPFCRTLVLAFLYGSAIGALISPFVPKGLFAQADKPVKGPILRDGTSADAERLAVMTERQNVNTAQIAMLSSGYQDMSSRLIRMEAQTELNGRLLWAVVAALGAQVLAGLWHALKFKPPPVEQEQWNGRDRRKRTNRIEED